MAKTSYYLTRKIGGRFHIEIREPAALAHSAASGFGTAAEARAWIAYDRWLESRGSSWQRFAARYGERY